MKQLKRFWSWFRAFFVKEKKPVLAQRIWDDHETKARFTRLKRKYERKYKRGLRNANAHYATTKGFTIK